MDIKNDFSELLELFNAHGIEFLVVGGYALACHGVPRATGDMDLFVRPDPQNAEQIVAALGEFGFGSLGLSVEDFVKPDQVVQLGVPPVRVDLLTSIDGVSWEQGWRGKVQGTYGSVPVWYIGRRELLANKRATGRTRDLADLEALGEEG